MTPLDLRAIRELCALDAEPWTGNDNNECPRCHRTMHLESPELERVGLCRYCELHITASAPQLLALVEELQAKNAELTRHFQAINQAERLDHISTIGEVQKANEKLAEAMKLVEELQTALGEACRIAESHIDAKWPGARERIAALRAIGQLAEGGGSE